MTQVKALSQQKMCPVCLRSFKNRKKWTQRGIWESVVYCSKRCRTAAGSKQTRTTPAFTIVELLIVVVVIAILAVIAVVAYRGISDKAYNSRTVAMIKQAQSALESHKTIHGKYPSGESPYEMYCLGKGYPANACGKTEYLDTCPGGARTTNTIFESAEFNTAIRQTVPSGLPAISHPPYKITSTVGGCTFISSYYGPFYSTASSVTVSGSTVTTNYSASEAVDKAYVITYLVKMDTCPIGYKASTDSGWTECAIPGGDVR